MKSTFADFHFVEVTSFAMKYPGGGYCPGVGGFQPSVETSEDSTRRFQAFPGVGAVGTTATPLNTGRRFEPRRGWWRSEGW
eukprot:655275-Prorocentrum_minimum.AAC.2